MPHVVVTAEDLEDAAALRGRAVERVLESEKVNWEINEAVDRAVYRLSEALWAPRPGSWIESPELSKLWSELDAQGASYEEKTAASEALRDQLIDELPPKTAWLVRADDSIMSLAPIAAAAARAAVVAVLASGVEAWLERHPEPPGEFESDEPEDDGSGNLVDLIGWLETSSANRAALT